MQKRAVERRLAGTSGFSEPQLSLEQYPTPPAVAAQLVHVAAMRGDLTGVVLDLGTGTGRLALAAACHEPRRVVGIDVDGGPLRTARANERHVSPPTPVSWVRADATRAPVCVRANGALRKDDTTRKTGAERPDRGEVTVVANPPFGAQDGREGADRAFLSTAADCCGVSYTIHNAGSQSFVESFAADEGGEVTDAFAVEFALDKQFAHQTESRRTIDAEAYRIVWGG